MAVYTPQPQQPQVCFHFNIISERMEERFLLFPVIENFFFLLHKGNYAEGFSSAPPMSVFYCHSYTEENKQNKILFFYLPFSLTLPLTLFLLFVHAFVLYRWPLFISRKFHRFVICYYSFLTPLSEICCCCVAHANGMLRVAWLSNFWFFSRLLQALTFRNMFLYVA